ncbi:MAG: class II fructose-bisphosphate aldolase, partial [Lentisphaeria bacterium]|nr:class II fructose-bisphosphate aldolase [Lentisphaeria bacterium]
NGICKINIYSELCIAWNTAIRDMLNNQTTMSCWVCKGLNAGMEAMVDVLARKIRLFKAEGKA